MTKNPQSISKHNQKTFIDGDDKEACKNSTVSLNLHKARFADILWGSDFAKIGVGSDFTSNYNSANLEKSGMLQEQMEKILTLKNVFAKEINQLALGK